MDANKFPYKFSSTDVELSGADKNDVYESVYLFGIHGKNYDEKAALKTKYGKDWRKYWKDEKKTARTEKRSAKDDAALGITEADKAPFSPATYIDDGLSSLKTTTGASTGLIIAGSVAGLAFLGTLAWFMFKGKKK